MAGNQDSYEPGTRVYYRENGRSDTGRVVDSTHDSVTVKWDADGTTDEYLPSEIKVLPTRS